MEMNSIKVFERDFGAIGRITNLRARQNLTWLLC
jgi:hypothetical protein